MRAFRAVSRVIRIAVLCFVVVNLHSAAAAAFHAYRDCPSISEPGQVSPDSTHSASCSTRVQCCPVLVDLSIGVQVAPSHLQTPLLDEVKPFLLVRTLYPPPKQFFGPAHGLSRSTTPWAEKLPPGGVSLCLASAHQQTDERCPWHRRAAVWTASKRSRPLLFRWPDPQQGLVKGRISGGMSVRDTALSTPMMPALR